VQLRVLPEHGIFLEHDVEPFIEIVREKDNRPLPEVVPRDVSSDIANARGQTLSSVFTCSR
jgi:hypothetical protein